MGGVTEGVTKAGADKTEEETEAARAEVVKAGAPVEAMVVAETVAVKVVVGRVVVDLVDKELILEHYRQMEFMDHQHH